MGWGSTNGHYPCIHTYSTCIIPRWRTFLPVWTRRSSASSIPWSMRWDNRLAPHGECGHQFLHLYHHSPAWYTHTFTLSGTIPPPLGSYHTYIQKHIGALTHHWLSDLLLPSMRIFFLIAVIFFIPIRHAETIAQDLQVDHHPQNMLPEIGYNPLQPLACLLEVRPRVDLSQLEDCN